MYLIWVICKCIYPKNFHMNVNYRQTNDVFLSLVSSAIYGVLRSVHGLKAHDDAIILRGGAITEWYKRMEKEVQG